jgi:hypothetical protein
MDEIVAKEMRENPAFREKTLALRAKQIQRTVRCILEQRHWCRFALFYVVRKECTVNIRWEYHASAGDPNKYHVLGCIREMSLIPAQDHDMDDIVAKVYGNGSVELKLEEGRSYYFDFYIDKSEPLGDRTPEQHLKECSDCVSFQVAVPLSDAHKEILKALRRGPEEGVQHEVRQFLRLEDVFGEELKNGIEEIKRKKLPPEEEEERISKLVDRIKLLREHMGQ